MICVIELKGFLHICELVSGPVENIILSGQIYNVIKHFRIDINSNR